MCVCGCGWAGDVIWVREHTSNTRSHTIGGGWYLELRFRDGFEGGDCDQWAYCALESSPKAVMVMAKLEISAGGLTVSDPEGIIGHL